jgi:thiamine pyrophosphate-dependent acetolactate synthase large subunit-like protein
MAKTAADVLVEGIIDWGVDTVFGLPGDGNRPDALPRQAERVAVSAGP